MSSKCQKHAVKNCKKCNVNITVNCPVCPTPTPTPTPCPPVKDVQHTLNAGLILPSTESSIVIPRGDTLIVPFNDITTQGSWGISLNSAFTIKKTALYDMQYSITLENSDTNNSNTVSTWISVDGVVYAKQTINMAPLNQSQITQTAPTQSLKIGQVIILQCMVGDVQPIVTPNGNIVIPGGSGPTTPIVTLKIVEKLLTN